RRIDVRESREVVERVEQRLHEIALRATIRLASLASRPLPIVLIFSSEPQVFVLLLPQSALHLVLDCRFARVGSAICLFGRAARAAGKWIGGLRRGGLVAEFSIVWSFHEFPMLLDSEAGATPMPHGGAKMAFRAGGVRVRNLTPLGVRVRNL